MGDSTATMFAPGATAPCRIGCKHHANKRSARRARYLLQATVERAFFMKAQENRMKTAGKWVLGILLTLVTLLVVAVIVVYTFDWNRAKPRINTMVSEATGRTFAIEGDLGVNWQRDPLAAGGWRRYVPLPVIRARQLHLGNPDWAEHDDMARVDDVSFGIELLPLIRKTVVLRALTIDGAEIAIERDAERNNWTFETPQNNTESGGEPWKIAVSELRIRQADLAYRDKPLELSIDAKLATLEDAKARENRAVFPMAWASRSRASIARPRSRARERWAKPCPCATPMFASPSCSMRAPARSKRAPKAWWAISMPIRRST
ncbi:AsmA family protein [Verticiella alkaliphila]|uniref:AsmA family protein n=1 Tax=Verticiella alkaliphila TaxID=2779529 RepID=UPI00209BA524|nr:AsmA family protein [Verticiella sp. GG226]